MKYRIDKCNIKFCDDDQHGLLLCKKHFDRYIIDDEIYSQQLNVMKYSFVTITAIPMLKLFWYNAVHYSLNSRVRYVEHFPLETLYLYHHYKVNFEDNEHYKKEQIIEDFDFEENIKIGHVKSALNVGNTQNKIEQFSERKYGWTLAYVYSIAFVLYAIVFFSDIFLNINLPHYLIFKRLFLCAFLLFPAIILGIKFIDTSKVILTEALSGTLYKFQPDNIKFVKASESIFNRIHRNEEKKYSLFGNLMYFIIFLIILTIKDISSHSWKIITSEILLILTGAIMAFALFQLLWINLYLVPITRRFHKAIFNWKLYKLDGSLGIDPIRNLFRYLILYDVFIIATYLVIFFWLRDDKFNLIAFVICSYIIGWNFSSIHFLIKLYNILFAQYLSKIKHEKEKLENSLLTERFDKYKFIESLKLDLVFRNKLLINFLIFATPFVISYLIDNYETEIIITLKSWGIGVKQQYLH